MRENRATKSTGANTKNRFLRRVIVGLLYFLSISAGSLFGCFLAYWNRLPQVEQLENHMPPVPSRVYSRGGQLIGQFFVEKRILLHSMDEISPFFTRALVAVEDAEFFEHPGIDPQGIIRALYVNLTTGRAVQGGSTLTQQLVKMLFLKPEKTLERKVQEAMLAVQLERKYTKQEIFLMYCNHLFLGHGAYGVQAASKLYFGKDAKDLNLEEGALLAALPKAPQEFSPYLHPDRALGRRNHVLMRMAAENFITQDQYEQTIREALSIRPLRPEKSFAPYYVEEIRKRLEQEYDYRILYEGGLQIYSTLDASMQKVARKALSEGLRRIDKKHGWRRIENTLKPDEWEDYWSPDWTKKYEVDQVVKGLVLRVNGNSALIRIGDQVIPLKPTGWAWTKRSFALHSCLPEM